MTSTQQRVLVIGLVVMIGAGAALFGGFIPGVKPNFVNAGIIYLNGTSYNYEAVYLNGPIWPSNHTSPAATVFQNVTFQLWVTNWYGLSGGIVRGNGTEPNGTTYSFDLGHVPNPPVDQTAYISPDGYFAVAWRGGVYGGPTVGLFVRV